MLDVGNVVRNNTIEEGLYDIETLIIVVNNNGSYDWFSNRRK